MMTAENRIGDAVNEPRVLPDHSFDGFISAALGRSRSAQDHLSCQHSSALNHEDRSRDDSVQEFLEEERNADWRLRGLKGRGFSHADSSPKKHGL
jgi:hypothetical protein